MSMTLGLKFLLFIPKCKFVLIPKNPHSDVDNYDKVSCSVLLPAALQGKPICQAIHLPP